MGRLRDYFKSFFGVPEPPLNPNEIPREIQEDFYRQFGHNFESRQWPDHRMYEHLDDFNEQGHNDIVVIEGGDMFREMESMFENFFKGFPLNLDSPQDRSDFEPGPGIESPSDDPPKQDEPGFLKDKMLKQPDTKKYQEFNYDDEGSDASGIEPHSWFGGLWTSPFRHLTQPDEKVDKDLDSEIESGNQSLDEILSPRGNADPSESLKPMNPWSSSSSSSFSQVTTIDSQGRTESKTTRRDSSGREEVTVTRKIGDQEHTVKHWKNEDGSESLEEKTVNLDQGDVSEFNQKWHQPNEGPLSIIDKGTHQQDAPGFSSFYESLLEQFFGPRGR